MGNRALGSGATDGIARSRFGHGLILALERTSGLHERRSYRRSSFGATFAAVLLLASALDHADAGEAPWVWQLPPGFPAPLVPADNPLSAAKVALGCRLFFETRLSVTGTKACASCHQPELGFTDGRARAVGARGDVLKRSAMSLTNVAYNARFDWADARVTTLEQQMRLPLFGKHPVELGLAGREAEVTRWLAADADYARAFREAFPATPTPVSIGHLVQAIATYERTLISGRSPFDRYLFDDDREALSPAAKRGMALFYSSRTGCGECHSGLNFSGALRHAGARDVTAVYANTGVAVAGGDRGLATTTMRRADAGRFRVPTLRNVALTAPYMHDGSLPTLEAVIAHYEEVGQRPRTRDSRLDPRLHRFTLSGAERDDLRAFLESLTDREFIARHVACPRR